MEIKELIEKIKANKQKLADIRSMSNNLEEYQKSVLRSVEGFLAYLEKEFKEMAKNE